MVPSHLMRQRGATDKDRYSVRAVDRALDVLLACASGEQRDYTLADLATAVGLEKPTVHRLVRTLEARRFIERRSNGRYALGNILATLGMVVVENWDLSHLIAPTLRNLVEETRETAFCSILDRAEVLTIASAAGGHKLRLSVVPGERAPAAVTADGRVLLAQLPDDEVIELISGEMDQYPGHGSAWLKTLLSTLDAVRRTGAGYDLEEHQPELRCVSIPLRGHRGEVVAALAVAGPTSRLNDERLPELVDALKRLAPDRIPPTDNHTTFNGTR